MADLETRTLDQQPRLAEVTPETLLASQPPGGSMAKLPVADLAEFMRRSGSWSNQIWPTTAESHVPRGIVGHGAITAGSGGANGTHLAVLTGGNFSISPVIKLVVSGGALTQLLIEHPGEYIGAAPSVPSIDFAASVAGLAGAAAALTAGFIIPAGGRYMVRNSAGDRIRQFANVAGAAQIVAPEVSIASASGFEVVATLAEIGIGLRPSQLQLPGTRLDFAASRNGGSFAAGNPAASVADNVAALVTFNRASSAWEWVNGSFSSYGSGSPAYGDHGVAIRPARTQLLEYGQNFSQSSFWAIAGIATPVNGGTGPLGVAEWDVTLSAGSGAKSIRQTEPVVSGTTYVWSFTLQVGTHTDFILSLGSAPFQTGGNPLVYFNLASKSASLVGGTVGDYGIIDLGGGRFTIWISKEASSSATGTCWLYFSSGSLTSWTAAGTETCTLSSADFCAGNCPVPPIPTPGTSDVTRAADVLSLPMSGTRFSAYAEITSSDDRAPGGTFLALSDGTTAKEIAVVENAGSLRLRVVNGGTTLTADGPTIPDLSRIAISYDGSTVNWAVNGADEPSIAMSGLTGLTKASAGNDGAGGNQLNGYVGFFETAAAVAPDLAGITGGGASSSFDESKIVVIPSASLISVFSHQEGGRNQDWVKVDWEYRNFTANKSRGWARGQAAHVIRTGQFSFSAPVEELCNSGAWDDSMKIVGEAANAFLAIVASGGHGWIQDVPANTVAKVDGAVINPASAPPMECNSFHLYQEAEAFRPSSPTTKVADRWQEWFARAGNEFDYRSKWRWAGTFNVSAASYIECPETQPIYDLSEPREGQVNIGPGFTTDAVTYHPAIRGSGGRYWYEYQILSGWLTNSRIVVQAADGSTAEGKTYFMHRYDADRTVNAGDVETMYSRIRFGMA